MSKKQTKTNHSQQDSNSEKSYLSQPADIHNSREQKLKESINKFQLSILNDIAKCSYLDGRKEGIKEERERIMKIIDKKLKDKNVMDYEYPTSALREVKEEIKGDEK